MTDPHSQALQGEGQCVATLSPHNVAILFNVYLCNHILLGSGTPSTDVPGAWQHCGDSMLRHIVPRLVSPDCEGQT